LYSPDLGLAVGLYSSDLDLEADFGFGMNPDSGFGIDLDPGSGVDFDLYFRS